MLTVRALNVNDAFAKGMMLLAQTGVRRSSRNGQVLVAPEAVTTHYAYPTHRVLFHPTRNANPFFHLFEALWMLAGRRDVDTLSYVLPRMAQYSDDGVVFHGAYGYRWRHHFGFDQLENAAHQLYTDPTTRRVIVQMFDAREDQNTESKDIPCNIDIKFMRDQDNDRLNMIVFNRSNDIIWGAYGANAVHFSILQEYMAARTNLKVGYYEQVSSDFHAYIEPWDQYSPTVLAMGRPIDPYTEIGHSHVGIDPLVMDMMTFDRECQMFVDLLGKRSNMLVSQARWSGGNPFFEYVAAPMLSAFILYRNDSVRAAVRLLDVALLDHGRNDWLVASHAWMERRAQRRIEG